MIKERDELFQAIAQLGKYALEEEKKDYVNDRDKLLHDSTEGFGYFLFRMFFRGRFDWLSELYANETLKKVLPYIKERGWEQIKSRPQFLSESKDPIGLKSTSSGYKFPEADARMVYGSLRIALNMPYNNPVRYAKECIEQNKVRDIYGQIIRIPYVKDKLACLFLRDVSVLYDLTNNIQRDDFRFFLPIDTWVKRFCQQLQIIDNQSVDNETVKNNLIKECDECAPPVHPIQFNHGLWVLSQITYTLRYLQVIEKCEDSLKIIKQSRMLESSM
jgi:hypothetical protein